MPIAYNSTNAVISVGVSDYDRSLAWYRDVLGVEDWHEVGAMVRLSTFYDPDGTSWMLAQTLDDKSQR